MENLLTILSTVLVSGGVYSGLALVLKNYLDNKLKGEISKDIEKFKGTVIKDLEEFRIREGRVNILSSRYVEVITNQRILWLEKIREDISGIIGLAKVIFYYEELLRNYFDAKMLQVILTTPLVDGKRNDIIFEEIRSKYNAQGEKVNELLQLIVKLKLRLNKNDTELVNCLNNIENGVVHKIGQNDMDKYLDKLVELSQVMLKTEWEKAKKEVTSGKEEK